MAVQAELARLGAAGDLDADIIDIVGSALEAIADEADLSYMLRLIANETSEDLLTGALIAARSGKSTEITTALVTRSADGRRTDAFIEWVFRNQAFDAVQTEAELNAVLDALRQGQGSSGFVEPKEAFVASVFESRGFIVHSNVLEGIDGAGKQFDALLEQAGQIVDSVDFKRLEAATLTSLRGNIRRGASQTDSVFIDAQGPTLRNADESISLEVAVNGLKAELVLRTGLRRAEVIGVSSDYDLRLVWDAEAPGTIAIFGVEGNTELAETWREGVLLQEVGSGR